MNKFSDLNLSYNTLEMLSKIGLENPTLIQSMAIPHILNGEDVIGQAQTGTGKTFAYILPAIEKLEMSGLQKLVLCPTRELALQVSGEFKKFLNPKYVVTLYGGQKISSQLMAMRKDVKIAVATPGRFLDHMRRKSVKLDKINMVVVDEADEMFNMGFIEDISSILENIPKRQTLLFSATIPKPIISLARRFQKDPIFIKVPSKELTVDNVRQHYLNTIEGEKSELLFRILDKYDPQSAMIFCNTKRSVDDLVEALRENDYLADALHGDMKQFQRDKVMNAFRSRKIKILVATDVASRGLDIKDVEIVVNYDLPNYSEYYVHRVGRTGRMGKGGIAFTFVTFKEMRKLREIEKYAGKIEKLELQYVESKDELSERIRSEINGTDHKRYIEDAKMLIEEFPEIEIIAALLKINEMNLRKRNLKNVRYTQAIDQKSRTNPEFSRKKHVIRGKKSYSDNGGRYFET